MAVRMLFRRLPRGESQHHTSRVRRGRSDRISAAPGRPTGSTVRPDRLRRPAIRPFRRERRSAEPPHLVAVVAIRPIEWLHRSERDLHRDARWNSGSARCSRHSTPPRSSPADVDIVFSTTVTGLAVPTLEARLATRIGLRPDVKRVPLFGLGCVAGAAGVARMHDYLLAFPDHVAVLLAVELCSLTLQRNDFSIANLVADQPVW